MWQHGCTCKTYHAVACIAQVHTVRCGRLVFPFARCIPAYTDKEQLHGKDGYAYPAQREGQAEHALDTEALGGDDIHEDSGAAVKDVIFDTRPLEVCCIALLCENTCCWMVGN